MTREIVVDARWLEPPQPMERVLAALGRLGPGEKLRFLIHREPFPLYPILQSRGYRHRIEPLADGCYALTIEPMPPIPPP